jgi:hypothetical protein
MHDPSANAVLTNRKGRALSGRHRPGLRIARPQINRHIPLTGGPAVIKGARLKPACPSGRGGSTPPPGTASDLRECEQIVQLVGSCPSGSTQFVPPLLAACQRARRARPRAPPRLDVGPPGRRRPRPNDRPPTPARMINDHGMTPVEDKPSASELALANRSWLAAVPIRCHFRGDALRVGKCRVEQQIPAQASGLAAGEDRTKLADRPWLVTDVLARDESSAKIVAADHFDEARALLRMLSDDIRGPIHTDMVTISKEGQPCWARSLGDLYVVRRADAAGTLWPSMHELSEAMTRSDQDRTDWERRTVAACRWYHRAASAGWPLASRQWRIGNHEGDHLRRLVADEVKSVRQRQHRDQMPAAGTRRRPRHRWHEIQSRGHLTRRLDTIVVSATPDSPPEQPDRRRRPLTGHLRQDGEEIPVNARS